jgi:hypothetical protein
MSWVARRKMVWAHRITTKEPAVVAGAQIWGTTTDAAETSKGLLEELEVAGIGEGVLVILKMFC